MFAYNYYYCKEWINGTSFKMNTVSSLDSTMVFNKLDSINYSSISRSTSTTPCYIYFLNKSFIT